MARCAGCPRSKMPSNLIDEAREEKWDLQVSTIILMGAILLKWIRRVASYLQSYLGM